MLRYPSPLLMVVILLQPLANALFSQAPDQTKGKTLSLTYDFKEAGKAMKYSLYIPTSYDKEEKSPLIVALHGLGSSASGIMRYPGFTRQAEKHGYLIVAPDGLQFSRLVRFTRYGWWSRF